MKVVLSKETLAVLNTIREALEKVLGPGVAIEQCDFSTCRDWSVVGEGLKYFTTTFDGYFTQQGKQRHISAELIRGYAGSEQKKGICSLTLDDSEFPDFRVAV